MCTLCTMYNIQYILLSQIFDSPNVEDQVPVFISPRNRVTLSLRLTHVWVLSYITTDGQSASLSWNKAPIWGLWPDFYYCLTTAVFYMGRPLWREDGSVFYNVQCTTYNIFYCLRFETRSLYLYPPGTGWPGYTPRHWVDPIIHWLTNQLRVFLYLGANGREITTSNSSSVIICFIRCYQTCVNLGAILRFLPA
jgi:hypothetical protein